MFFPYLAISASDTLVSSDMKHAAKQITSDGIAAHMRFLSSDALEGRGPATRADKLTQEYLQSELAGLGIKPGAAGGRWIQPVPLVGITSYAPETLTLTHGTQRITLKYKDDFIASSGVQKTSTKINDAEIVFVGYGVVAPEFKWNDFKDVDVKGKVLLVMNHNPSAFAGNTRLYYGRWTYKYEEAARHGAAGVIVIHTTPSAAYPWQVVQSSWTGKLFELKDEGEPHVQVKGWATEDASRKIVSLSGNDLDKLRAAAESRDFRPVPLGVKMSITLKNTIKKVQSANVVGMIPGSDPKLAHQAIVYSSHHDHLGMKEDKSGEQHIFNGAIDNASGVAALLAIAKAYKELHQPVKRTVYFVLTAAEEQGLLGSQYFVAHPPVPVNHIAANLNIDGIGFYGKTSDLTLTGMGKSNIDNVLIALAATQGRIVRPDPKPEHGSFYRADQFNFAKAGVPVAYFYSGVDAVGKPDGWGLQQIENYVKHDYHQTSDKFKQSYDFSGAVEDAQLNFYLGVKLANAANMPVWNKGDEFEAVRHKSLNAS
jgi:Zn-dependent M28 family amino/carboxypeptidase